MFLRSFTKIDRGVLTAAILIAALSVGGLYDDEWLFNLLSKETTSTQVIGKLSVSDNDVRRKASSGFSWLPQKKNSLVNLGDSIFTGNKSTAKVVLNDGGEVNIQENSLVVMRDQGNKFTIDISFGTLKTKIKKGQTLYIKNGNNITKFVGSTDSEVNISLEKGKDLSVSVKDGQVMLSKNGSAAKPLGTTDSLPTENKIGNAEDYSITLNLPEPNARILFEEGKRHQFSWQTDDNFKLFHLQVAYDPEFKNKIIDTRLASKKFNSKSIPHDVYIYWRVSGQATRTSGTTFSSVRKFKVVPYTPPLLKSPEHKMSYDYIKMSNSKFVGVSPKLSWQAQSQVAEWQVEVSKDPSFINEVLRYKTSDTDFQIPRLLAKGTHYWRVKSREWESAKWSEVNSFTLKERLPGLMEPPTIKINPIYTLGTKTPSKGGELRPKSVPEISWNTIKDAETYLLQIASDPDFKKILLDEEDSKTKLLWKDVKPGQFYARVRSFSKGKGFSFYSKVTTFKVQMRPPKPYTPNRIEQFLTDMTKMSAPPQPVELKWSPIFGAKKYLVKIGPRKGKSDPQVLMVTTNSVPVNLPKSGSYYWSIQALDDSGRPVSAPSEQRALAVYKLFKDDKIKGDLKLLKPQNMETLVFVGNKKSEIFFWWTRPFKKMTYRIEVSDSPEFTNTIESALTKINSFVLKKNLPSGWIFWRVRAENDYYVSSWTKSGQFQVQQEKNSFDINLADQVYKNLYLERQLAQIKLKEKLQKERWLASKKGTKPTIDGPEFTKIKTNYVLKDQLDKNTKWKFLRSQKQNYFFYKVKDKPKISWQDVVGANTYTLEISRQENFLPLILSKTIETNQFEWDTARPGLFYARVRANGKHTKDRSYGPTSVFYVNLPPPEPITKGDILQYLPSEKYRDLPPQPIALSWTPISFARSFEIKIAKDSDFENSTSFISKTNEWTFQPQKYRDYFYKVRGLSITGQPISWFSEPAQISVKAVDRLTRPIEKILAYYPRNHSKVTLNQNYRLPYDIHWIGPKENATYTLQISDEPGFTRKPIYQKSTTQTQVNVPDPLPVGRLYWRVGTSKSGKLEWSETFSFYSKENNTLINEHRGLASVKKRKKLYSDLKKVVSKVHLSSPRLMGANSTLIIGQKKTGPAHQLSWSPVSHANRYLVEVARDQFFSSPILRKYLKTTSFQWNTPGAGKYYWRVRAYDELGAPGLYSSTGEVHLMHGAPKLYGPDQFVHITVSHTPDRRDQLVDFHWTPIKKAKYYDLEVSTDKEFKVKRIYKRTAKTKEQIRISTPGEYFWRVRAVDRYLQQISEYSNERALGLFHFYRLPKVAGQSQPIPRSKTPAKRPLKNLPQSFAPQLKLSENTINFTETEKDLELSWTGVPGAKSYKVEWADNYYFTNAKTRRTQSRRMKFEDLDAGRYFFRVHAITENQKRSAYSKAIAFTSKTSIPKSTTPEKHVRTVAHRGALFPHPERINLSWSKVPDASFYRLEIANDPEFKNPKVFRIRRNSKSLTLRTKTKYYWRVRALDQRFREISDLSAHNTIQVEEQLRLPSSKK